MFDEFGLIYLVVVTFVNVLSIACMFFSVWVVDVLAKTWVLAKKWVFRRLAIVWEWI